MGTKCIYNKAVGIIKLVLLLSYVSVGILCRIRNRFFIEKPFQVSKESLPLIGKNWRAPLGSFYFCTFEESPFLEERCLHSWAHYRKETEYYKSNQGSPMARSFQVWEKERDDDVWEKEGIRVDESNTMNTMKINKIVKHLYQANHSAWSRGCQELSVEHYIVLCVLIAI